jgi:hypothetical protein
MSGKIIDNQGGRNPSNNGGGGNTTSQILIDAIRSLISIFSGSIKVKIPENIVNPEGSKTVDVYRLQTIGSGLTETIIEIIASKSETFRFIRYGFFNNKA